MTGAGIQEQRDRCRLDRLEESMLVRIFLNSTGAPSAKISDGPLFCLANQPDRAMNP